MRKTALITGASSDIGRAIVSILAESGFNIAAHYYQNATGIQQVEKRIAKSLKYDLRQAENAKKMVEEVVAAFGQIDLLVNTIGPFYHRDILEVTPEQWQEAIDLNLNVAFNVTHYALKHLIQARGQIINFTFSGVDNPKGWDMSADYCAAKAGIAVLTKSLAKRLAPLGVRVNAVAPGLIKTPSSREEELLQVAKDHSMPIPFGRTGRSTEVAEVVKWLVAECPEYITGVSIPVAGGWEY